MLSVLKIERRKISHSGSFSPKHLAINWSFRVVDGYELYQGANPLFCSVSIDFATSWLSNAKRPSPAYFVERERRRLIFRLNAGVTYLA